MLPPIRKSLAQKIKEEELDDLGKVENINSSHIERKNREDKCKSLNNEEKQQLKDFVFGKSDFNPLAKDKK